MWEVYDAQWLVCDPWSAGLTLLFAKRHQSVKAPSVTLPMDTRDSEFAQLFSQYLNHKAVSNSFKFCFYLIWAQYFLTRSRSESLQDTLSFRYGWGVFWAILLL